MNTTPQQHPDTSRPRRSRRTSALRRLVLGLTVSISVVGLPGLAVPASAASAASAPAPLVTQIADEPVSVGAAAFRRHLFVAADAARLSDPAHTADLLAEQVLQHLYALAPQTDPAAAAAAVQVLRDAATAVTGRAFDSRITSTMVLFQQAALGQQGPVAADLQRATTEVVALTARKISTVAADTHAENALGTTGDTESRLLAGPTFTPTAVLLDSATLADANPAFAAARDLAWRSATGASISDTSADLLAAAPTLRDNADVQALAALRDRAGDLVTTGRVIAGTPSDPAPHTIGSTVAQLGDALATTRESAETNTGSGPLDPGAGAAAAAAVEDARASQTALALQTGFLTGGSSGAKELVDQVGLVAVQVTLLAQGFSEFSAGNVGQAALSGNVLGVVMTLLPGVLEEAGVFGPSTEDLMITQLDNISQQMADFQNAVTGQFAVVFERLSRVSAQIDDISQKLDRAVIDIEQARVQIGQMYDSLTRLQGSLDAVQNNILEALRNGTNSQLRQTISSALGYEERNGSPLPASEFNNAAAYLHTFATVTARHSPELNTDYPSFDVQNDANQLSTGIASNVDFLDQVPSKRGWADGRLSGTTGDAPQLANVDDFVLASRAYAQLMLENPDQVSAGYRRWLSDIQQLGGPLAALTSAIATSDSTDGTHSNLLNRLVCARTTAAFAPSAAPCQAQGEDTASVDALVDQATGQLTSTVQGFDDGQVTPTQPLSVAGGTTSFDPFVDSAFETSDLSGLWSSLPGRRQVDQCAVTGETQVPTGPMERPDNLTPSSQGVPQVFQWADRMGLGSLDVCYKATVRQTTVDACQYGGDTDTSGWIALNVSIALPDNCARSYWLKSKYDLQDGRHVETTYSYDDIAFVWTFAPKAAPSAPIYVQSVVRRGADTATAMWEDATVKLPPGGYTEIPGAVQQYSDNAESRLQNDARFRLHTDARRAAIYTPLTTADAVRKAWGDATTATPGVFSYQATTGPVAAGDALDQAITGLDPKKGTGTVRYARTCDPLVDEATTCQPGTDGASIVGLGDATASVADATDAHLSVLQSDIYRQLLSGTQTAGSTASGPLHDALVRLDGANAMLSSFLQLGASQALRAGDLTSLPADLGGSRALTTAIRAELSRTVTGAAGTGPDDLVAEVLDRAALDPLDGLLPEPGAARRQAVARAASTPGPVNPAIQATNDQLTLTAIALGAPVSSAPAPTSPAPTTPTTPPSTTGATPAPVVGPVVGPVAGVAFTTGLKRSVKVHRRYKSLVTATGGSSTYSWTRLGRLPLGMKGRATGTGRTYVVAGRPRKTGTYSFILTATDATGVSTTQRYRIRVR